MHDMSDYSDGEIATLIISGGLFLGLVVCMGSCGLIYGWVIVEKKF